MAIVEPADFYRASHQTIFRAIIRVSERGGPVDLLTVVDELDREGELEKVGGAGYIATLTNMVPATVNADWYAHIVREKAILRQVIAIANRLAEMGYEEAESSEELVAQAEQQLLEITGRRSDRAFVAVREVLLQAFAQLERFSGKEGLAGVPTGYADLDRMTAGLQPGDLVLLAARPSMGKTSLALGIAQHVACKMNMPVGIFSMEMPREQLVKRLLCAEAMIDSRKLRTGPLTEEDWQRLTRTAGYLARAPLFIDDTPSLTVRELRVKAKRLQAEHGLGLLVIDYLQLMQATRRAENRQQEMTEISRSLKALAKELNVPIVALSQLSRAVEQRHDKRPIMSDLRESGALEQDADVIIFIYRDEYYYPDTENRGVAEIIVAKQRNGPVGTVELGFLKEYARFVSLARE
jgi:replicative DNA helicase